MSSDDPGAQSDPHNRALGPPRRPGDTKCRGASSGDHEWQLGWDEPLGVMWVCAVCKADWFIRF